MLHKLKLVIQRNLKKVRDKPHSTRRENSWQDSLSSLPRQTFFSYLYCFLLILILSITGLTRILLIPGLFLGILLIAWDEMNHLASIERRKVREINEEGSD